MAAEPDDELTRLRARNALLEETFAALLDLWAWQGRLHRASGREASLKARRELDVPLAAAMARFSRAFDALALPKSKKEGRG